MAHDRTRIQPPHLGVVGHRLPLVFPIHAHVIVPPRVFSAVITVT
jgi:hypothetical protein